MLCLDCPLIGGVVRDVGFRPKADIVVPPFGLLVLHGTMPRSWVLGAELA